MHFISKGPYDYLNQFKGYVICQMYILRYISSLAVAIFRVSNFVTICFNMTA